MDGIIERFPLPHAVIATGVQNFYFNELQDVCPSGPWRYVWLEHGLKDDPASHGVSEYNNGTYKETQIAVFEIQGFEDTIIGELNICAQNIMEAPNRKGTILVCSRGNHRADVCGRELEQDLNEQM